MPYTLEQVNDGQARINYELCEVDMSVMKALEDAVGILKAVVATQPLATQLKDVDFNRIEETLRAAYRTSREVADIIPPGCQGPGPYPG